MTKYVKIAVIWPLLVGFLAIWLDPKLAKINVLAEGCTSTIVEVILAVFIVRQLSNMGAKSAMFWAPLLFGLGDLTYGISNYLLKAPVPNTYWSLIYVFPYIGGMGIALLALVSLAKKPFSGDKKLTTIFVAIFAGVFILSYLNIVEPALFHKKPVMPLLLQILTVVFTVLECALIALSATLLLVSTSGIIQLGLFGILVMQVSDIALRYQSVNTSLIGMTFFENAWCIGLGVIALAAAVSARISQQNLKSLFDETWLPLKSIRGMTIGLVLSGYIFLWLLLSFYFESLFTAYRVSGTLLATIFAFAFSIAAANVVTGQLAALAQNIKFRHTNRLDAYKVLPEEIQVISNEFNALNMALASERDHVLNLTSQVAHDLRTPIAALKTMVPSIRASVEVNCGCKERVHDPLKALELCSQAVERIAQDVLQQRKQLLRATEIRQEIQKATQLISMAHPNRVIDLKFEGDFCGVPLPGLDRVLENLIVNAIEASPSSSPVQVICTKDANKERIIVKDSGTGFTPALLDKIVGGQAISTKPNGNGLGLTSALEWARENNLTLTIGSTQNLGTEVTIELKQPRSGVQIEDKLYS